MPQTHVVEPECTSGFGEKAAVPLQNGCHRKMPVPPQTGCHREHVYLQNVEMVAIKHPPVKEDNLKVMSTVPVK